MIRTLVMARHFGDIFFFHPHYHLISSHYHFQFMGEDTEAQTSEEKYPRPSDGTGTEIQIQVWTAKLMSFFLPCLTFVHPFHKSLLISKRRQGEQAGGHS